MKLKSPQIDIPSDKPYFFDKLQRQEYGDSLYRLFKNLEDSNVICLDAAWGEGKTTFIKMWISDLQQKEINCIYFDAYENDYLDDPFIPFISEIITLAEDHFADSEVIQEQKDALKKKAILVGKTVLSLSTKIGLKLITSGIVDSSDIDEIIDAKKDVSKPTDSILSEYVLDRINSYNNEKEALINFKELLSTMGEKIREIQNFPLVIIIDELDRCRPDFALKLLERIKHIFSVENVSFLIPTNLSQLENYIEKIYGDNIDAHNYLHKFFTITTSFPPKRNNTSKSYHKDFLKLLCEFHGLDSYASICQISLPLFNHLNFSLREIERFCSVLTIYYANKKNNNTIPFEEVIPLVAILKTRFPDLFSQLLNNDLKHFDLINQLNLESFIDNSNTSYTKERLKAIIKHFLLSDEEFNEINQNDLIKTVFNYYNTHRRKYFLSNAANDMDRYQSNF